MNGLVTDKTEVLSLSQQYQIVLTEWMFKDTAWLFTATQSKKCILVGKNFLNWDTDGFLSFRLAALSAVPQTAECDCYTVLLIFLLLS